jgi:DNA-binding transcriptional regulator YdaS (Cro superfamily)
MDLRTYLSSTDQKTFAGKLGVTQGLISQWVTEKAPPPPARCVAIERMTNGAVTRRELRSDWAEIWPELTDDSEGLKAADDTQPVGGERRKHKLAKMEAVA